MNASYVSATQFTIAGDQTALFPAGRRVRGDCGVDGYKYGTVQSSSYSDPNTTVTLEESVLTSNLATVHYGVVKPGATGSLPDHASEHHSGGRDPIDHGSLPGLGDDDHTQYIKHALATAVSDFLVASGAGVFIKKTLAEVQALIEGSTNLADAISKKHAKDEDTYLDKGGANEVTAAQAKAAYTHAGVTSGNPHQVSRSDLGLATTDSPVFVNVKLSGLANGKIPYHVDDATGLADGPTKTDVDSAVSLKHTQGSDTTLGNMTADINMNTHKLTGLSAPSAAGHSIRATATITEANLGDAISKRHTQDTDTKISLTQAPGSDHTATGVIGTFTAGEALVFGQLCYMKSDSKFWKIDANAETTMPGIAMALASISAGATGPFLFLGVARDDSWAWTVGGKIYASETPGALTQTAPTTVGAFVQLVGIATHADRMLFNPELSTIQVK